MDISLILAARPSIVEGFARLLDIGGTLNEYNSSIDGAQADDLAFSNDIATLRQDVAAAREQLCNEASCRTLSTGI